MIRFPARPIAQLALVLASVAPTAVPSPAVAELVQVPERTLTCVLGRSTNLDPSRNQRADEVISEGHHRFALRLPAAVVDATANPDPSADAEPVDPRARIVDDPDHLTQDVPVGFNRVVDLWPKRVEMMTMVKPPTMNLIIVSAIDPAAGTAHLFMTRAQDAASLDLTRVYQGDCTVSVAPPALARGG